MIFFIGYILYLYTVFIHYDNEYQGTGIGLSICRKVVNQYFGEIGVESKVGVGSTFISIFLKILKIEFMGNKEENKGTLR